MSSKAFKARTGHNPSDPQICGLHDQSSCVNVAPAVDANGDETEEETPGAIMVGEVCFYLTCRGDAATTESQIQSSKKADGYDTGFRIIPSGKVRTVGKAPFTRQVPIFKWQEQGENEQWHDLLVWEKMVHKACAESCGYRIPGHQGRAHKGNRTKGFAHKVNPQPIPALEELAAMGYEADREDDA